eukprot:Skav200877  [mRNA]  locus=scaffold4880:16105:53811:+ [translate_table: standard]
MCSRQVGTSCGHFSGHFAAHHAQTTHPWFHLRPKSSVALCQDAVKLGEDKSEEHTATITQKTSSYEEPLETLAEIEERKNKGESLSSEKEARPVAQCRDDQESFASSEADLAAAVVALESAVSKVSATQAEGAEAASLVQFGHLQKSLDLAEALGFVQSQKKAQALALLQQPWLEKAGAEYNKKDYAFQSSGVVSTLQDLLKQFREERNQGQEEWKKTKQAAARDLDMVQGLVNQLLEEAANQAPWAASQKGFCESAMGKATMERDRRLREAKKLTLGAAAMPGPSNGDARGEESAKLGALHSQRSELSEENELLKDAVAKLEKDLLAATDLRTDESKENLKETSQEIKEAKQGFEATKEAIVTLVDFYKSAGRSAGSTWKSDVVSIPLVKEPEVGFEGSYGGKQTAAKGVISMLEAKREQELEALKTAMCTLDKDAIGSLLVACSLPCGHERAELIVMGFLPSWIENHLPDADEVFAYDTVKLVRILDRRLGCHGYGDCYDIVIVFILNRAYQDTEKSVGWMLTKVVKPQVSHLGISWDAYDRITNPGESGAVFIPTRILITRGQTQEDEYCESPAHPCKEARDCNVGDPKIQKMECQNGFCMRRQWCPAENANWPTTEVQTVSKGVVEDG